MATDDMTPQERLDRCASDMARAYTLTLAAAQDVARAMVALGPIIDAVLTEAGFPLRGRERKGQSDGD
jgi:hypothetical protein